MNKSVRQLADAFAPAHYKITLNIAKRVERIFSGQTTITGRLISASDTIVLHSKALRVTHATINGVAATIKAGSNDELILSTGKPLPAGEYQLDLHFTGTITDAMSGLYPSYYKEDGVEKELLLTQLESHSAREVFPCIDEPAAKATFNITLITEPDRTVIGNMPIEKQVPAGQTLTTQFQTTPKMSPYLVAFTVGELDFLEAKSRGGVTMRVYTTPSNVQQARFTLDLATKTLDFMDEFFGVSFPLPKCDIACVPDFSALAMENWGLIIGRELAFLVDETHSSAGTKQLAAQVVVHELAHQWFGNLVTMQWWDDLWLNESFAKWMEDFGVDHFYPEWRIWEQFKQTEQNIAFTRDSLADVQAVRQPVHHPDELHGLFDPAIVYAKGSCLILMLQHFIGMDAFRAGLRAYMQTHMYSNATADDLWDALETASGKDVKQFMLPWLTQPGHPVVHVASQDQKIVLSQHRFFANSHARPEATTWPIPLLSNQLEAATLTTAEHIFTAPHELTLLNSGGGGFYHTQYESETLTRVAARLKTQSLPALDCQTFLIDGLQLSRSGAYSAAELLRLIDASKHYESYAVWQAIAAGIDGLRQIVNEDTTLAPAFRRYIANLARPQYERLGWDKKPGDSHFDTLLRQLIISMMIYSGDPVATQEALARFDAARSPADLPAELRTSIIAAVTGKRGADVFEQLITWYTSASPEERLHICAGIVAAKDPRVAKKATALFTTKTIKPQDLRSWYGFMVRNPHLRATTWQWITNNWGWIEKHFKGGHEYSDFPKYIAMGLVTADELAAYRAFFEPKLSETELTRLITQGIDDISARLAWRERDLQIIADYIK